MPVKTCLHGFFAFEDRNYAWWMPVFMKDMACLPEIRPNVNKVFTEGKFVVQRSEKDFSLMAMDQRQEHIIKFLKEQKYPEVLRVIDEFENSWITTTSKDNNIEDPESLKDLKALLLEIEDCKKGTIVSAFKEAHIELVAPDTGDIMDQ